MSDGSAKLATARRCVRTKQGEEALRAADEARELFNKAGDKSGVADALRAAIVATALKGDVSVALTRAVDELSNFKSANDRSGQAIMLQATAEVQVVQGLADDALMSIGGAESLLAEAVDRPALKAELLLTQADAHLL